MGNTPLYLANNIFRVDTASKLTSDKEYGIDGFMTKITIIKSRSNRAGQEIDLVYNQNRGFDNIYSNLTLMKQEKKIGGAGRSFFIQGCDSVKFAQKNFKEKLLAEVELQKAYKATMRDLLSQFIFSDDTEVPVEDNLKTNEEEYYEEEKYSEEYYEEDYED